MLICFWWLVFLLWPRVGARLFWCSFTQQRCETLLALLVAYVHFNVLSFIAVTFFSHYQFDSHLCTYQFSVQATTT